MQNRIEDSIPGYAAFDLDVNDDSSEANFTTVDWQMEFQRTRLQITKFVQSHDPLILLSRSATRLIVESEPKEREFKPIEQSSVEMIQAMILAYGSLDRRVPISPRNFIRIWEIFDRNIQSFVRKTPQAPSQSDISYFVSQRARVQTVYYRNFFTRSDCEHVLNNILSRVDSTSHDILGYKLSVLYRALVRIADIISENLSAFSQKIANLLESTSISDANENIKFFVNAYPGLAQLWNKHSQEPLNLDQIRYVGLQLSELAHPWIYTVSADMICSEFPQEIVDALWKLSWSFGDLSSEKQEYFYLDNPIWHKPYINYQQKALFVALPQLVFSFPFTIMEGVMKGNATLDEAYATARERFLEEEVFQILQNAMPSATVYCNVMWCDPESGQNFENDVVATIGNYIFIFEAKSGRLKDAARRGGSLSLEKNFKELFVDPGIQAWRLQNYLNNNKDNATLRTKSDGTVLRLNLDKPKIVYKYSICIEHFTNVTNAKSYLKMLGLVSDDTAWAPVLSIGELKMIDRFLDSEISFVHYLTRRATLEEMIDFDGDEQDLLSLYLTNGFWIDAGAIKDRKLMFHRADDPVRQQKIVGTNRAKFELRGIDVSPFWRATLRELYQDARQRHRFDVINTIMNQHPPSLAEIEKRIRQWKRGKPHSGQDVIVARFQVGNHMFLVAVHLIRYQPNAEELRRIAFNISRPFILENGFSDCAVFTVVRRSKQRTFDGLHFIRLGTGPKPESVN